MIQTIQSKFVYLCVPRHGVCYADWNLNYHCMTPDSFTDIYPYNCIAQLQSTFF